MHSSALSSSSSDEITTGFFLAAGRCGRGFGAAGGAGGPPALSMARLPMPPAHMCLCKFWRIDAMDSAREHVELLPLQSRPRCPACTPGFLGANP